MTIGKETKAVGHHKVYIKYNKARVLIDKTKKGVNILGIGDKNNAKNMKKFSNLMKKHYNIQLDGY